MKRALVVITLIASCITTGCVSREDVSRYVSIPVPQYSRADYYNLLSDANPEIVYNAVCNLSEDASSIAGILSNPKSDTKSKDYIIALKIFNKILQLLESRNEKILASSLRFLQLFSEEYRPKDALIAPIMKIRSTSTLVQCEQLMALSMVASQRAPVDVSFLRKLTHSKSWLVSRSAYRLINTLENETLREELIRQYTAAENEAEKLLILTALENNFSKTVFGFLASEIISTRNPKIKKTIFSMLHHAKQPEIVLRWIDKSYEKLSKPDRERLVQSYIDTFSGNFSSALLVTVIGKGYIPDEKFLKVLFASITEYQNKKELSSSEREKLNNSVRIEEAITARQDLAGPWEAVKTQKAKIRISNKAMTDEYAAAANEFVAKTEEILKKYNIDEETREECLKDFSMLGGYLEDKLNE